MATDFRDLGGIHVDHQADLVGVSAERDSVREQGYEAVVDKHTGSGHSWKGTTLVEDELRVRGHRSTAHTTCTAPHSQLSAIAWKAKEAEITGSVQHLVADGGESREVVVTMDGLRQVDDGVVFFVLAVRIVRRGFDESTWHEDSLGIVNL